MLKKTIALLLLILCFTSCTGNMHGEDETSPSATVSEWRGLETIKHKATDSASLNYFARCELTGTPDPTPPEGYVQPKTDLENITCQSDKEVYSLSDHPVVYLYISYAQTEKNKDNSVELHKLVNLERWNGESWDRLIYYGPELFGVYSTDIPHVIASGETQTEGVTFGSFISAVIPGKYRAVFYVDYYPVYAEFEITE